MVRFWDHPGLWPNGSQAQDRIEAFDDGLQQYVQDEGEPDSVFPKNRCQGTD
jgi:hypothetical protein